MSPELVLSGTGGRGPFKLHLAFLRVLLLGGSNVKKGSDRQKNKFFINNSIKALILFKE